jgi:hypothetical protein
LYGTHGPAGCVHRSLVGLICKIRQAQDVSAIITLLMMDECKAAARTFKAVLHDQVRKLHRYQR